MTAGFFGARSYFLECDLLKVSEFMPHEEHINYLELVGFVLTLRSFIQAFQLENIHIVHQMDNIVALTYANRLGGRV